MKKILLVLMAILGVYVAYNQAPPGSESSAESGNVTTAIAERRSGYQVRGSGTVIRQLADDNNGSRHQRFIVRLASGQTLLIAHNIDLAPRANDVRTGATVSFFGEYEWNERGGVIHWTHRDPRSQHVDGWLEINGQRYQ